MHRKELPGDVILALRESAGYIGSPKAFAELNGFSYDTLRRLEMVKWGTLREDWVRPVRRQDLDAFVNAGFVAEGDEYWDRFMNAFFWQHAVMRYAARVYEEASAEEALFEPVLEEHVVVIVRAVTKRVVRRYVDTQAQSSEGGDSVIEETVTSEILLSMRLADFIRPSGPDTRKMDFEDQTRALQGMLTTTAEAETPFLRTLRLVYELAEETAREALGISE